MTERQNQPKPTPPASQRDPEAALPDAALDRVSGGTDTTPATSNIMKTKHDTAKNSISNVR